MITKIKITLLKANVSVIATLRDDKCPIMISKLLTMLPHEANAFHAKWGGGEIWTQIPNFPGYAAENETFLPSIGEIILMPLRDNLIAFDLWYDRGWAVGSKGLMNGACVGIVTEGLEQFAPEAEKLSSEGSQKIRIEIVK
ncbi:MAG: DUF3830 family protein [Clostridiaceae bacterium]|jgi:hypothetical protein|nr:DUF3830 family protein [Clostridiaceae bacterium]